MKFYLRIVLLLLLLTGTLTQDGFDLFDALDDKEPTPAPKPTEKPKANDDFGLDLSEALGPDVVPEKPKKPAAGGDDLNLFDALGPDTNPKPDTPVVNPPKSGGGGGTFGDSDLVDVSGGNYSPDGGHSEGGGAEDSGHNTYGGGENQPEDPDLPLGQFLKMLNANMPEEFFMWFSSVKKALMPLLERAMDLLNAVP
ncbi:CD99 molecule isoform X2 [Genypterus blacodes]|uniref:CD99 molecule isoform X2 n=1 Tax=Genypterus blacodes TaxID=154954 RepID=UPI003F76AC49